MANKNSIISNFLKKFIIFIFFIKYLILIFALSSISYIVFPKFLNQEKNIIFIKKQLQTNYNIVLNNYKEINYIVFPTPRILLSDVEIKGKNQFYSDSVEKLFIILNLKNLYNYSKTEITNIIFEKSIFEIEINELKKSLSYINNLDKKLSIKNSLFKIKEKEKIIFNLSNIYFKNSNFNELKLDGLFLNNKFNLIYNKQKNKKLKFVMPTAGINFDLLFDKESDLEKISGLLKAKVLGNRVYFNFKYNNKNLKIINSYFRSKSLNTSFDGLINLQPYLDLNLNIKIKKINFKKFLENLNSIKITSKEKILKKLNGNFEINYTSRGKFNSLVNDFKLSIITENGNIIFNKSKINFSGGIVNFDGNIFKQENIKKLEFDTTFEIDKPNKFLKKVGINNKKIDKPFFLYLTGLINISSNKIYFNSIKLNSKYVATLEDKLYYKKIYETILSKGLIWNIFNRNNIKNFILEIN